MSSLANIFTPSCDFNPIAGYSRWWFITPEKILSHFLTADIKVPYKITYQRQGFNENNIVVMNSSSEFIRMVFKPGVHPRIRFRFWPVTSKGYWHQRWWFVESHRSRVRYLSGMYLASTRTTRTRRYIIEILKKLTCFRIRMHSLQPHEYEKMHFLT